MRSSWIRVGPTSNDKRCPLRDRKEGDTERHCGKGHMKMEAEIRVMFP